MPEPRSGLEPELTDEQIIARVQAGEPHLFALIFERHAARLARFLRQSGLSTEEREDLLGETFARAFSRVGSFRPDSGTRYLAYLYSIARNLTTDRLRERSRAPAPGSLEDLDCEPHSDRGEVERLAVLQEDLQAIRAALDRLSPGDRQIILLSYDREMSCREIMAAMGKPSVTSVTTHLYKAMKRLRRLVSDEALAGPSRAR